MINTWDICCEIPGSITCESGEHQCQRGEFLWKTMPAYQNSQTFQTPVKGLIPIFQYPSSFIFDIFNTTETYRF